MSDHSPGNSRPIFLVEPTTRQLAMEGAASARPSLVKRIVEGLQSKRKPAPVPQPPFAGDLIADALGIDSQAAPYDEWFQ